MHPLGPQAGLLLLDAHHLDATLDVDLYGVEELDGEGLSDLLELGLLVGRVDVAVELGEELDEPVVEAHLLVGELLARDEVAQVAQEQVVGGAHEGEAEVLEEDADEEDGPVLGFVLLQG